MNVLMVDQFGEFGGAQKCLLDLLAGWPPGDTLIVAAPPTGTLLESAGALGYETTAIPCGPYVKGKKGLRDIVRFCGDAMRQRMALRRAIAEWRIDVVYVNGPRVLPGAALAARGRCSLVYHVHNPLTRGSEAALVRGALKWCEARVIACCRHAAGDLSASVIHNGVADAGYRERRYPPDGVWKIGIAGRIAEEKGHLILLEAVRELVADGHRIRLVVVGAPLFSGGGYAAEVRRKAEGLDVRFTGWKDDARAIFRDLDLLTVPSIAEPGLPRVVLEAFSAGVPVVGTDSGGIAEAVRDNVTGFLVADPSVEALAMGLREAMLSPALALTRVARTAREEWVRYWNVERWCGEVVAAIRTTATRLPAARSGPTASATTTSEDRSAELV